MSRLVIWCAVALWGVASVQADDLLDQFQAPPATARPTMRWWWNGNAVETKEITRELDVLQQAEMGGVEICPIAIPHDGKPLPAKSLKWLSPEWCQVLKTASGAAAKRGMHVDLVAGCGRPWGGDFVPPEHAAQRVDLVTRKVIGPTDLTLSRDELLAPSPTPDGRSPAEQLEPELLFLRLVPAGCAKLEEVIDLIGSFDAAGMLTTKVPEGEFTLCIGVLRKGFLAVEQNPDGPGQRALDHYNGEAVRGYLDHIAKSVRNNLGDDLGKFVQTLSCDAVNLSGANWTGDFAEEFKRRSGYDLGPYLPFVVDFEQRLPVGEAFAPTVARVRHDYAKTIADLFRDRFVDTFTQWCHEQGARARMEMGVRDWATGVTEAQLVPDVPQASSRLFVDTARHGFPVWNKYASSGGHLADRRVISARAMVNTRGVFQESLAQVKAAGDLNFVAGANHTVLNGFNYSPREAGFPGWVHSGTYFSPISPWWQYLPQWVQYNSRLSAVFQQSRPVVQIAILAPTADVWGDAGLSAKAFRQTPWYAHELWRTFSQHGCSADYVSQKALQRAKCQNGKLCCGPMEYDALVVVDAQSLAPATTSALVLFADGGGRLAFVGRKPERATGFNNSEQRDQAVTQAMKHLADSKDAKVFEFAAPEKPDELFSWTGDVLTKLGVPRSIAFQNPNRDLLQVHYRHNERDVFFLVNTNTDDSVMTTAVFSAQGTHAWRWDAETGQRAVYPTAERQADIALGPQESLLLVFETSEPPVDAVRMAMPTKDWQEKLNVSTLWTVEFIPVVGRKFTLTEFPLNDLGASGDERLEHFAGTIVYRTHFQLAEVPAGEVAIELGTVHGAADVQLNHEPLGAVWYGAPRFDATRRLRAGENALEIRVATSLFNYTQSLSDNPTAQHWKKLATNQELMPTGLIGPVRLVTPAGKENR